MSTKLTHYILTYESPLQLIVVLGSLLRAQPGWLKEAAVAVVDQSTSAKARAGNAQVCERMRLEYLSPGANLGVSGGRRWIAEDMLRRGLDYALQQGDGLMWQPPGTGRDAWGFASHLPQLSPDTLYRIARHDEIDLLKLCYLEEYGHNGCAYAWDRLTSEEKAAHPEYQNAWGPPPARIEKIDRLVGVPYAVGNVSYGNWPAVWSARLAREVIAAPGPATEWDWMRKAWRLHHHGTPPLRTATLLATPLRYCHKHDYPRDTRRENPTTR